MNSEGIPRTLEDAQVLKDSQWFCRILKGSGVHWDLKVSGRIPENSHKDSKQL